MRIKKVEQQCREQGSVHEGSSIFDELLCGETSSVSFKIVEEEEPSSTYVKKQRRANSFDVNDIPKSNYSSTYIREQLEMRGCSELEGCELRKLLDEYEEENVYNCDETALFPENVEQLLSRTYWILENIDWIYFCDSSMRSSQQIRSFHRKW